MRANDARRCTHDCVPERTLFRANDSVVCIGRGGGSRLLFVVVSVPLSLPLSLLAYSYSSWPGLEKEREKKPLGRGLLGASQHNTEGFV